jgi:6-phosphogluconolactonase
MKGIVRKFEDTEALVEDAASFISRQAVESIEARGHFTFVLSGGNTPKSLYSRLSKPPYSNTIEWDRVFIFWGDERFVSKNDASSNYRMAEEVLLSNIPIPKQNILPVPDPGEADSVQNAASLYETRLRNFFTSKNLLKNMSKEKHGKTSGAFPSFDVTLLGVGDDGHTVSLYPGSSALEEKKRWVMSVLAPDYAPIKQRITLTLPALNNSKTVLFLVSGARKKKILNALFDTRSEKKTLYPAGMINPSGDLYWYTDVQVGEEVS